MIEIKAKFVDETKRVVEAAERASYENIRHATASIRKDAQSSIDRSPVASPPGSPPHSRRGLLRNAIVFAADKFVGIVGPRGSRIGEGVGGAHEFGGEFRENDFPERPFMGPALERNIDRFASSWSGSIG